MASLSFFFLGLKMLYYTGMVKELTGGYKIKYHANGLDNDPIEIDFTPPFRSQKVGNACVKLTYHVTFMSLKSLIKLSLIFAGGST